MIKFTRISDKLEAIAALAPDAVFVHVVRDPRAVAASMMMGRGAQAGRPTTTAPPPSSRSDASASSGRAASSRPRCSTIPSTPTSAGPRTSSAILLVWKHTFESTYRDGRRLFGERYVLLRNEELRADPVGAISRVYRAAERPTPPAVAEWARGKVRAPEVPYAANDPRWIEAFARLGMRDALEDAGYPVLADAAAEARAPSRLSGVIGRARARMARARD